MTFDNLKDEIKRKERSGFRPPRPMMSPYARNVAILILLSSFLLFAGIGYFSLESYFWFQEGKKPVLQTGGKVSTQTPIVLPPLKTTGTPTTIAATQITPSARTPKPTETQGPPQPSPEPSDISAPTASATFDGSATITMSPTLSTPAPSQPSPTKTQEVRPTNTPTPSPPAPISPTPTGTSSN